MTMVNSTVPKHSWKTSKKISCQAFFSAIELLLFQVYLTYLAPVGYSYCIGTHHIKQSDVPHFKSL